MAFFIVKRWGIMFSGCINIKSQKLIKLNQYENDS